MVKRGAMVEEMYHEFVQAVCRRSSEFYSRKGPQKTFVQIQRGVASLTGTFSASSGPPGRRDIYGIQHLEDNETRDAKRTRPRADDEYLAQRKRQVLGQISALP